MSAIRTTCPYCGVGCGLVVTPAREAERAASDPAGWQIAADPSHPANLGRMCSKAAALGETLGVDGRLLHPEIRGRRAPWDEALDAVAEGLKDTISRHGPDAVAFYVSGQLLTEDYYVANKLMKGFLGCANIDTNSRLCMASAVAGHKRAFGTDTVPVSYTDVERAELIVIVGSNTAWCHPVLFRRIEKAKAENPRMRIVVVDPRRTATADLADLLLRIRPGTDAVLLNGLLSFLRREDALDFEFLDLHTEGFGAALQAAKASAPSIPAVAAACGVAEESVATFYRWFAATPRTVTLFSQGVNQSTSGTDKVNAIINVHLATGRIGKPGAGPFSLTGQPNAMGGREVGGLANQLAAHMDFAPENVERVARFWHAPGVARQPGLKAVELFDAVDAGRIKAIWIMCTNPAVSMPDADRVEQALRRCPLVVVSECVRTDTTACADVLLPAATWGEKSGTVTNSERRISRQRKFLPPAGDSKPDWWIVTQVARRLGFGAAFPYESPAAIFREHARLSGFENTRSRAFDIGALANASDEEYEVLEPVQWPVPADREHGVQPFSGGRFFTPDGKARLVAVTPKPPASVPDERRRFTLNTGRVRDQWHTMSRTGRSPRLSAHRPEPCVQVHPADAARAGIANGDLARVESDGAQLVVRAEVTADVAPGQLFVPIHWSRQNSAAARVGALIPAAADPISGQPELKSAVAALERFRPAWHGFVLARFEVALGDCDYVARAKGAGYWRYEIAGSKTPVSLPAWARAALGRAEEGARGEWIELSDSAAGRYRAALISGQRLAACVFVAAAAALPDRSWLTRLFAAEPLPPAARASLLAGRPLDGARTAGPQICSCYSVGRDELLRAIESQGLVSTADIGRALRAGTSCGSCLPELKSLLSEARRATRQ